MILLQNLFPFAYIATIALYNFNTIIGIIFDIAKAVEPRNVLTYTYITTIVGGIFYQVIKKLDWHHFLQQFLWIIGISLGNALIWLWSSICHLLVCASHETYDFACNFLICYERYKHAKELERQPVETVEKHKKSNSIKTKRI